MKSSLLVVAALLWVSGCGGSVTQEPLSTDQAELRGACTLMQPYCPPECHLSEGGCPKQCHCPKTNTVSCGTKTCGATEVCCTGPIVNTVASYSCYPEGSLCPL